LFAKLPIPKGWAVEGNIRQNLVGKQRSGKHTSFLGEAIIVFFMQNLEGIKLWHKINLL
jgi:hypothetical protein